MADFRKLIVLFHQHLHRFLLDLVLSGIMVGILVILLILLDNLSWSIFFFAWTILAIFVHAVVEELPEPEEFDRRRTRPCNPPPTRNDQNIKLQHILQSSAVDKFRRQTPQLEKNGGNYAPMLTLEKNHLSLSSAVDKFTRQPPMLEKNGGSYAPMVMLEKKHLSLPSTVDKFKSQSNHLEKNDQEKVPIVVQEKKHVSPSRIQKSKLKMERKKNLMFEVEVLEMKQKKKRLLATSCDIELDGYLRPKRLKVDKDVNGTTTCNRISKVEKSEGRVEEAPDDMEVETHWDMLLDGVTKLMKNLILVEHSECKKTHSNMSIDDIVNDTMNLNLDEQLNQINHHMDMSIDHITSLMMGLSLIEPSDHIMDMCIENITNLMKVLSLTNVRKECFCIET